MLSLLEPENCETLNKVAHLFNCVHILAYYYRYQELCLGYSESIKVALVETRDVFQTEQLAYQMNAVCGMFYQFSKAIVIDIRVQKVARS